MVLGFGSLNDLDGIDVLVARGCLTIEIDLGGFDGQLLLCFFVRKRLASGFVFNTGFLIKVRRLEVLNDIWQIHL